MADYVTADQVSAFAHEPDALSVAGSDLLLTAASRLFDNLTEVSANFYAAAADPAAYSERVYYGNGTGYLPIAPYVALNPTDPIVIDPDYSYDIPSYVERDGMLVVYGSYIGRFVGWADGVRVTVSANWGFPAVPADVTVACAHLVIHLWRTADPAYSIISGAEGAATRVETIPKVARDIITEYKARYRQGFEFA